MAVDSNFLWNRSTSFDVRALYSFQRTWYSGLD